MSSCFSLRRVGTMVVATLMLAAAPARGELVTNDPIGANFYLPELIIKTHETLGLSEEQKADLKAEYDDTQQHMGEIQSAIEKERQALIELVKKDKVDEKQVLDQAEKVLNLEGDAKRAQLRLLIRIKNKLTPEQQAKLNEYKQKIGGIQEKMRKAKELAEGWKSEGRDLSALEAKRGEFEELMKAGKVQDAEKLLDEALKTLSEKK